MKLFQILLMTLLLSSIFSCKKKDITDPINDVNNWSLQTINLPSQAVGKNLYSISKQGNALYISGDGIILKSNDNGSSWSVLYDNSNVYFFDVKFTDNQTGYAVGWPKGANALNKVSSLYKTIDGGSNWFLLYSSTRPSSASTKFNEGDMRNGSIDFLDESRMIWGCGTTQFYSVTGGRGNHCTITPVQTYSASLPNIDKAFFGSSGILESLKGGVSFGISGYQSSDYYDLDLVSADDIYSITWTNLGSEIIKIKVNQNNTSTFKEITGAATSDKFYGIDFLDLNFGVIVGTSGKVAYTTNGGDAWSFLNSTTTEQLNDVLFYNNQEAIVIGNNGTVLKLSSPNTSNNYNPNVKPLHNESTTVWSNVSAGSTNDLYDIEFKSGNVYIVGDGVILKSTDQGSTFNTIYSNANISFRDISFVDANLGWTIGYNSSTSQIEVYKTNNGGLNWSLQTTLTGSSPGVIVGMVVEAFNSNYILASYAYGVISEKKISSDGGTTWTNVGGNFEAAPIADFIFFGTNYTSTGYQGYGPKLGGGGSYVAQNLNTGGGATLAGCNSLTGSNWVKNFGMNSISSAQNHMAIARDKEYILTSQTEEGLIERSKVANPITGSDWGCYYTYTDVHFYGVEMVSITEIWLAGENGTIITTKNRNGGIISSTSAPEPQKEWYGHNTGTHEHLYDLESVGNNIFIAVGKNGTIIRSN
jgi:photosystem II stability/assembly factor-like uncharacterized protein